MRTSWSIGLTAAILGLVGCSGQQVAPSAATSDESGIAPAAEYAKDGFETFLEDGRLWVFATGAEELKQLLSAGELAKHVTFIAAGPGGITLKAPDRDTAVLYLSTQPGFAARMEDSRVWVFRAGAEELAVFDAGDELAKHVTRINAGPLRTTIKAPDTETIDAFLAATSN